MNMGFRIKIQIFICTTIISLCCSSPITIKSDDIEEGKNGIRKVASYYMVQEDSSVRLECIIKDAFTLTKDGSGTSSLENIKVKESISWTFNDSITKKNIENVQISNLEATGPTTCKIYKEYEFDKESGGEISLEVACKSELTIDKIYKESNGQYHCKGRIESSLGGEQISFVEEEHKLLLFVEITSIITMAVTGIIVTTVALIVIAGICCRMAGHHFAWEYQDLSVMVSPYQSQAISRNESLDDNTVFYSRASSRHTSNASNMSGIVMQADPEAMARLFQRLDYMEDAMSDMDSKLQKDGEEDHFEPPEILLNDKGSNNNSSDEEKTSEKIGQGVDKIKGSPRTLKASKDETKNADSAPELKQLKELQKQSKQQEGSPSSLKKSFSFLPFKSISGRSSPVHTDDGKRRRSMVSVLPSAIGIGPGISMVSDDSEIVAASDDDFEHQNRKPGHHHQHHLSPHHVHHHNSPRMTHGSKLAHHQDPHHGQGHHHQPHYSRKFPKSKTKGQTHYQPDTTRRPSLNFENNTVIEEETSGSIKSKTNSVNDVKSEENFSQDGALGTIPSSHSLE